MNDDLAFRLAEFFKIFGDFNRIKLVNTLLIGEMHVQEIADAIGMSQSAVSHQLKMLRLFNVVKLRKDGQKVYYSLSDEHIEEIFKVGVRHMLESEEFDDIK